MFLQCIAAFVILALAVVNASVIPYGAWGSPWAAPWGHSVSGTYQHIAAPHYLAAPYAAHLAYPYAHVDHVAHIAPAATILAGSHAAHVAAVPHAASYIAANRGSVHTAPLPGHTDSVASVNDAPAPGTW